MELTNPTSTPLPSWASGLIPDLHDAIWSGGGHHDHAAWCALEVLQRRGLLVQSEPETPPMPVPGDAEGLAEVFWGRYDQPEPEGVTDEALANFTAWFCRNYPGPDTIIHKPEWHSPKVLRAAAHALTRWGHPIIKPVPVSERLPGPEDCALWPGEPDANQWAWAAKCVEGGWEWTQLSMQGLGFDSLRIIAGGGWTHWLPHHALPLPQQPS